MITSFSLLVMFFSHLISTNYNRNRKQTQTSHKYIQVQLLEEIKGGILVLSFYLTKYIKEQSETMVYQAKRPNISAVPPVGIIHCAVWAGLSAWTDCGRVMYGVAPHLCSAGLDKTSVWIYHLNIRTPVPRVS